MTFLNKPVYLSIFSFVLIFLLFSEPSSAATLTVGTDGDYSTIDSAITAAKAAGGSNEIRVQTGIYYENILQFISTNAGALDITGGWNSSFTSRNLDYTLTTVDGSSSNRIFHFSIFGSGSIILTIDGFTIQNGGNNTQGSGILIDSSNECQITINNNRIINNVSGTENSITGGGIYAYFSDTTDTGDHILNITNNLIKGNTISSSNGSCSGAGLDMSLYYDAVFHVTGNIIEENSSTTDNNTAGGSVRIYKTGSGTCDFSDNIIRNNISHGSGHKSGIAGEITMHDSSSVTLLRNQWIDNTNDGGDPCGDLHLIALNTSTIIVTDSLFAGAVYYGIELTEYDSTATIRMTNLTIAGSGTYGLYKHDSLTSSSSLYNTILYNNGTNYNILPGDTGNNLMGTDPEFMNSSGGNYHLRPDSPAINAGTNSPTGGLGSLDLDSKDRIAKLTVDIGAYEFYPAGNAGILMMLFN